jgi:polyisoprenoid-binding protein YceI
MRIYQECAGAVLKGRRYKRLALLFRGIFFFAALAVFGSFPSNIRGQRANSPISLDLDPAQSKINWTLSATFHTVHGTFACSKGSIQFDPSTGKVAGQIVADSRSGESGDADRDKNMHQKVLESEKYPTVIFMPDRVDGAVDLHGDSKVQVHGSFEIHGVKRELTVPADVNFSGDRWTAKSSFEIPYVQWGMKNPSNFFLHVGETVKIDMELAGVRDHEPDARH